MSQGKGIGGGEIIKKVKTKEEDTISIDHSSHKWWLKMLKRRHVKRVYIIPNDNYIINLTGLYMSLHGSEYKWFREDEKHELFHMLKLDNFCIKV